MDTAIDGVLQGLIDLAGQGVQVPVAVQVGGVFVEGIVSTAAEYRQELAQRLGHTIPVLGSDDAFLHLREAAVPSVGVGNWYRCPLFVVQGLIVHPA